MELQKVVENRDTLKMILTKQQNKLTMCKFRIQKYKLRLKEFHEEKERKFIKSCCCCSCSSCQHPRQNSYENDAVKSLSISDLRSKCQELSEISERMATQVNVISSAFDCLTSSTSSSCSLFTSATASQVWPLLLRWMLDRPRESCKIPFHPFLKFLENSHFKTEREKEERHVPAVAE